MRFFVLLCCALLLPSLGAAQTVRLEVTADATVTNQRGHEDDNWGASVAVPIRQTQNWSGFETKAVMMRFDTARLAGVTPKSRLAEYFPFARRTFRSRTMLGARLLGGRRGT